MATRSGKHNPVESKAGQAVPTAKIIRNAGQAKRVTGKMTRRGDS